MSLGAETVAAERISEEKKNFNDPETSRAGLEGRNAADTSFMLLLQILYFTAREDPSPLGNLNIGVIILSPHQTSEFSFVTRFYSSLRLVNDFLKFLFTS